MADFREGGPKSPHPIHEQPQKSPSWIGLRNEENEKLRNEENEKLKKENEQLRKNNVVKDANIKESIEKPKEIKSPKENQNTTDSYPN